MTSTLYPDLCIIGAGAAGLTAAASAAAFGVRVVLIESGLMGGDCLHHGCVPSKALIAAARHAHACRRGAPFGIVAVEPEIDFSAVAAHIRATIEEIAPNDSAERFEALGVQVIRAEAKFINRRTVVAGDYRIRARRFIVATGSKPHIPAIPGLREADYLTNETIFSLRERPEHLLILGAGPAGLELAQAYRRLGSAVTVIEAKRALRPFDAELARPLFRQLAAEGVTIFEDTLVTRVEHPGTGRVVLRYHRGESAGQIEGSHLLVVTGRSADLSGIDPVRAGIRRGVRGVHLDARLRTTNRRIHVIGDAAGGFSTHGAAYQAALAVRAALFRFGVRHDARLVPRILLTDPEIAEVGLNEAAARALHGRIHVLRWAFADNDRAVAERRTEGFIKVIASPRGRVLGAGIVGAHAVELIGLWSLAVARGMRLSDIVGHVPPYPSYGEVGRRAAIAYYAPHARRPLVRRLIGFLRMFG